MSKLLILFTLLAAATGLLVSLLHGTYQQYYEPQRLLDQVTLERTAGNCDDASNDAKNLISGLPHGHAVLKRALANQLICDAYRAFDFKRGVILDNVFRKNAQDDWNQLVVETGSPENARQVLENETLVDQCTSIVRLLDVGLSGCGIEPDVALDVAPETAPILAPSTTVPVVSPVDGEMPCHHPPSHMPVEVILLTPAITETDTTSPGPFLQTQLILISHAFTGDEYVCVASSPNGRANADGTSGAELAVDDLLTLQVFPSNDLIHPRTWTHDFHVPCLPELSPCTTGIVPFRPENISRMFSRGVYSLRLTLVDAFPPKRSSTAIYVIIW